MDPISLGLAGFGLAKSIFGGTQTANANEEMAQNIENQQTQADAFYNNRVNRDFLDTNAAKGIVEELRKRYQEQAKTIDSNTAATGGTAEGNIAAKTELNDSYNSAMRGVAGEATNYQDRGEMIHQSQLSDLAQQRMQLSGMKGQNASNLMQTGENLLGTAADVAAFGEDTNPVAGGSTVGVTPTNRTELNKIASTGTDKILKGNQLGLMNHKTVKTNRVGEDFFNEEFINSLGRG